MNEQGGQHTTAGWAVFSVGVLGLGHGAISYAFNLGQAFITPTDEMFIAAMMLFVGTWMIRYDGEQRDEQSAKQ